MSIINLGAICGGCGHPASFHPSAEHATAYLASTGGRHMPECSCTKGNPVNQFGAVACRCKATREEVGLTAAPNEHADRVTESKES